MSVPSRSRKTAGRRPVRGRSVGPARTAARRGGLLQRLVGADVEVVALPGPAPHPADEPGQDLEAEVERLHRGDLAVGVGVDDVDARRWPGRSSAPPASRRTRRPAPRRPARRSRRPGVRGAEQEHRERVAVRAVEGEHRLSGRRR